MVTINSVNEATGAAGTVLTGQGVGTTPTFSAAPTVTSITLGSGTALSSYVEGTWTPTLLGAGAAGSTTYTTQTGYYTRIGNNVTVWGQIVVTAATGTGNATIGALPFTVKNQSSYIPVGSLTLQSTTWAFPVGATMLLIRGTSNSTNAIMNGAGTLLASGVVQMNNSAATIFFTLSYQI